MRIEQIENETEVYLLDVWEDSFGVIEVKTEGITLVFREKKWYVFKHETFYDISDEVFPTLPAAKEFLVKAIEYSFVEQEKKEEAKAPSKRKKRKPQVATISAPDIKGESQQEVFPLDK